MKKYVLLLVSLVLIMTFQNCQRGQFKTLTNGSQSEGNLVFSAPQISMTAPVVPLTNNRNVNISFKLDLDSKTALKTVTCQLNNLAPVECLGFFQSYTNLADGDYTVKINAEDMRGQKAAEFALSFRVDATLPVVNITQSPAAVSGSAVANFAFTAVDTLSAVTTVECSVDNAAFTVCASPLALTGLAEGAHTLRVRATDQAQNISAIASANWTINTMAPTLNITAKPNNFSNSVAASFAFNGQANGLAITQFQCSLDNGAFVACASPQTYSALAQGAHTFAVRGLDINGTLSAPLIAQWTVDTVAPAAPQIVTTTTAITKLVSASFSFTSNEVATFQCSVDNGAFTACSSPRDLINLANGNHSFRVKAVDNATNESAISTFAWVIDSLAPTVTLTQMPQASTMSTTATFAFTANDGAGSGVDKFECSLNNVAFSTCTSPQNLAGLSVGAHNFRVRALDKAGNLSAVVTHNWTITDTVIAWNISTLNFVAGGNGSVDLKTTLPAGVKPGGTFAVDATGTALPAGMSLSSNGILSVGNATAITVAGVVFAYSEP